MLKIGVDNRMYRYHFVAYVEHLYAVVIQFARSVFDYWQRRKSLLYDDASILLI